MAEFNLPTVLGTMLNHQFQTGPIRICLDARLVDGVAGGVQQAIIGLAAGLSRLTDSTEEYLFLTLRDSDGWLRPYLAGNCHVLESPVTTDSTRRRRFLRPLMPACQTLRAGLNHIFQPVVLPPPPSDGLIEGEGVNVMHFTTPVGFLTDVPSIYQPWDLQHLHLPAYFSRYEYMRRELWYPALCYQAHTVVTSSSWVRGDLVSQYQLPPQKIATVPVPPPVAAYAAPSADRIEATRVKFSLPAAFIFYPAQTWPHKNHLQLLEALALLRDQYNLRVPLVSSGRQNSFFSTIKQRARELGLEDQLLFLGYVSPAELQAIYLLCRCVVFPSKFEGWGLPIVEAFWLGRPVACSNVTSLPELVRDAALLFAPDDAVMIAHAVRRLWEDDKLRATLVARGQQQVRSLSWEHTGRIFRALYRRAAGRRLSPEDTRLLAGA